MGLVNLNKIITEAIDEYLTKTITYDNVLDNKDFHTVYQVTSKNKLPSIFSNGFSREFTNSNAGNMYGAGIYTTFSLKSTKDNVNSIYGDTMVKILVPSYNRFFICNKKIAQEVYGNKYKMKDQIEILFRRYPKLLQEIKQGPYYKTIIQTEDPRTAINVQALLSALGGLNSRADAVVNKLDIRGFIFVGGHDGDVAVIKDFKNAIPVAYSLDGGKTFKQDMFSKEGFSKVQNQHDPIIFLGRLADEFIDPKSYRLINGYMRVQRKSDGKYNFAYKENENNRRFNLLLPKNAWVDNASDMGQNGKAHVYIDKLGSLYVDKDGFYEEEDDIYPIYDLKLTPLNVYDDDDDE